MKTYITPTDAMRLSIQTGMMFAEANMVIAMRLMGMTGMWRVAPSENTRMVNEKKDAAISSGAAMGRAILAGENPTKVALAGLKPIRRRTQSNAARLAKRGPGTPT